MSTRKSEALPVKQILQDHHLENEEQAEVGLVSGDVVALVSHFAKSKPGQSFLKASKK